MLTELHSLRSAPGHLKCDACKAAWRRPAVHLHFYASKQATLKLVCLKWGLTGTSLCSQFCVVVRGSAQWEYLGCVQSQAEESDWTLLAIWLLIATVHAAEAPPQNSFSQHVFTGSGAEGGQGPLPPLA